MINPLYHLTILPPKIPAAEALSQEITVLRHHFGGKLCYLNPNQSTPIHIPRLLFGFQKLRQLQQAEHRHNLHHFYNPDAFPFPVLKFLRRPIIYTITSGIGPRIPNLNYFSKLAVVIVPDERSLAQLQKWGLTNVRCVRAGIDTARFTYSPLPLEDKIRIMCASAPWNKGQFATKGFDAMLQAAAQYPRLNFIFLWRGILVDEIVRRVEDYNVGNRVQIINEQTDVNRILGTVHATITLASKPGIVKSYPHSLLDSIAAGKPVIVNRAIPMSDYVEKTGCGIVLEKITPTTIVAAAKALFTQYPVFQKQTQTVDKQEFSQESMINTYGLIYNSTL